MSDPSTDTVAGVDDPEMSEAITRSMGSVWERHTGARPVSISTQLGRDKVRCVIEGAGAPEPAQEDAEAPVAMLTVSGQRNEAIESVRRATHRRVVGFISKRDEKAGTSTQTFILDARRAKN